MKRSLEDKKYFMDPKLLFQQSLQQDLNTASLVRVAILSVLDSAKNFITRHLFARPFVISVALCALLYCIYIYLPLCKSTQLKFKFV